MKKTLLLLWVLAAVLPACCIGHLTPSMTASAEAANTAKEVTIVVVVPTSDNSSVYRPSCAGVWITSRTFLTAYHCVDSNDYESLEQQEKLGPFATVGKLIKYVTHNDTVGGSKFNRFTTVRTALVIGVSPIDDLAIASIPDEQPPQHKIASVSRDKIYDNQQLLIVGHVDGLTYTVFNGTVSSTRLFTDGALSKLLLQVSAPIWFGNSGGAAFDSFGAIVGIVSSIRRPAPSIAFLSHRNRIEEFLDREHIIRRR